MDVTSHDAAASDLDHAARKVPLIYASPPRAPSLGPSGRALGLLVAVGCLAVLVMAARHEPSRSGVGTHTAFGYAPCQFLARTGLPCPSCGMTTSFAWFVRGNLLASLYVQPMGTLLAALTAVCFWGALYIGITGKPVLSLFGSIPPSYTLLPLMAWAVIAWAWKMLIQLRGVDGW